ncbi:MAG: hflX, partial [Marmoricola sp.]|nr:hflX [Marmoricola sp.]
MTNAPHHFDLAQELADTADWDEETAPETTSEERPPAGSALATDPEDATGPDASTGPTWRPASALEGEEQDDSTGAMDLAERHQLRRVASLRTELEDITEVEYRQLRLERVILVGVWTSGSVADAENSMAELAALAETAGSEVL